MAGVDDLALRIDLHDAGKRQPDAVRAQAAKVIGQREGSMGMTVPLR